MTDHGTYYVTSLGASLAEAPEHHDFVLLTGYEATRWIDRCVFYHIFPDRFYASDPAGGVPGGA